LNVICFVIDSTFPELRSIVYCNVQYRLLQIKERHDRMLRLKTDQGLDRMLEGMKGNCSIERAFPRIYSEMRG
jgi:hypothetical protein